jgi:hypothetical protein
LLWYNFKWKTWVKVLLRCCVRYKVVMVANDANKGNFLSLYEVLTAHTTHDEEKNQRNFLFIKFYMPRCENTGGKNQYSVFSEHCFSHFMLCSRSNTHTSFSLLTHTPTYVFVATWKAATFVLTIWFFFSRISSQHKIIFVSFSMKSRVVVPTTTIW